MDGVEVTRLPNGLTVISHAMDHLASAAVGVWVGVGSRAEERHENGLSHLLEHMAFKGTRRRSAQAIAEEIEAVGGELNAATSVESTAFYARIIDSDLPLAVDMLSDILQESVFDAEELRREQHVILQELGAARDVPEDWVFDLFQETAWPDQPIGRPILGTQRTVRSFAREQLSSYLDTHYKGPSMVLSAAGSLSHDALVKLAESHFANVPAETGPKAVAAQYRGGERHEFRDSMETQIVLGFEGVSYGGDEQYKAQLLAGLLGGGMSSRLFQEVREKRGLCYSIYAFHWAYSDTGIFGIHAATGEEDIAELMPVMFDELERVTDGVSETELSRARAQMRASLLMAMESPAARASQIARQMLVYGHPLSPEEILDKIDRVTVGEVRDLASRILSGSTPTLASVGHDRGLPGIAEIAERFAAPSPA